MVEEFIFFNYGVGALPAIRAWMYYYSGCTAVVATESPPSKGEPASILHFSDPYRSDSSV